MAPGKAKRSAPAPATRVDYPVMYRCPECGERLPAANPLPGFIPCLGCLLGGKRVAMVIEEKR